MVTGSSAKTATGGVKSEDGSATVYCGHEGSSPSERKQGQPHGNPRQQHEQQQHEQQHYQHEQYQGQGMGQRHSEYPPRPQQRRWVGRPDTEESAEHGSSPPTKTGDLCRLFEQTLMKLLKEEEGEGKGEGGRGGGAATALTVQASSDVAGCHALEGVESPRVGWVHVVRKISALSVGDG